jgi:hypothetical protein
MEYITFKSIFYCRTNTDKGSDTSYKLTRSSPNTFTGHIVILLWNVFTGHIVILLWNVFTGCIVILLWNVFTVNTFHIILQYIL